MVKQAVGTVRVVVRRRARRAVGSSFELRADGASLLAPAERPSRHRLRKPRLRRWAVPVAALAIGGAGAAPAWGANVTNYTFHVPASVQTNPCFPGDTVNLNGDIHVVITATADNNGGFHTNNSLNSQLSGSSITTGTGYVNQENQQKNWYAGAPFPTVNTDTYDFNLISQSATANYVLHMQMHETVTAMGVPAAAVDHVWMDCQG